MGPSLGEEVTCLASHHPFLAYSPGRGRDPQHGHPSCTDGLVLLWGTQVSLRIPGADFQGGVSLAELGSPGERWNEMG